MSTPARPTTGPNTLTRPSASRTGWLMTSHSGSTGLHRRQGGRGCRRRGPELPGPRRRHPRPPCRRCRPVDPECEVMSQPVLEAEGLVKVFGPVVGLAGVDIQLYPGEVPAVIGDNGAGKST